MQMTRLEKIQLIKEANNILVKVKNDNLSRGDKIRLIKRRTEIFIIIKGNSPANTPSDDVITITGNEFGEFEDTKEGLKALRKVAIDHLTGLKGEFVNCPALNHVEDNPMVEIRSRGIDKIESFSADKRKLQILSKIQQVIKTAKYLYSEKNHKTEKKEHVLIYHYLRNKAIIDKEEFNFIIVIEKDADGLLHYDILTNKYAQPYFDKVKKLGVDNTPHDKSRGYYQTPDKSVAVPAGETSNEAVDPALYHASNENDTTSNNDNSSQFDKMADDVTTGNYVINLFFEDELNEFDDQVSNDPTLDLLNQANQSLQTDSLEKFHKNYSQKLLTVADDIDSSSDEELLQARNEVMERLKEKVPKWVADNQFDSANTANFLNFDFGEYMEMVNKPLSKRKELPNIIDTDEFLDDLKKASINAVEDYALTQSLKPTQSDFNDKKINNMINDGRVNKPIIISNDNYIVDGHHRYHARDGIDGTVAVLRIDLSYDNLFNFLQDKPYVKYKDLHE